MGRHLVAFFNLHAYTYIDLYPSQHVRCWCATSHFSMYMIQLPRIRMNVTRYALTERVRCTYHRAFAHISNFLIGLRHEIGRIQDFPSCH